MSITFKQKCYRCKKNYVIATNRSRFLACWDCQKKELEGEVKDPKMKRLFAIPTAYYEMNPFLREIKMKYLKFNSLSDKQVEAFKKAVERMKEEPKTKKESPPPYSF